MKKIISVILSIIMVMSAFSTLSAIAATDTYHTVDDEWTKNNETNRWEIYDVGDFIAFQANAQVNGYYNGETVVLMNDIVLNPNWDASTKSKEGVEYTWTPISEFKGTLDGQGHAISGIYIEAGDSNVVGIIKKTTAAATFKDLKLLNSYLNSTVSKNHHGGLLGQINADNAVLENIYSEFIMGGDAPSAHVGGIVGCISKSATMKNCVFAGEISAKNNAGGLIGTPAATVTVTDCANFGVVNTVEGGAGGLFGTTNGTLTVTNCVSFGEVSTSDTYTNYGAIAHVRGDSSAKNISFTDCYYLNDSCGQGLGATAADANQKTNVTVTYNEMNSDPTVSTYKYTSSSANGTTHNWVKDKISSITDPTTLLEKIGFEDWSLSNGKVMPGTVADMLGAYKGYNTIDAFYQKAVDDTVGIRVLGMIDSLDMKEVGFKYIMTYNGKTTEWATVKTSTVYSSIRANVNAVNVPVSASDFGHEYIYTLAFAELPQTGVTVTVRPYAIMSNGDTIVESAMVFTVTDGVVACNGVVAAE